MRERFHPALLALPLAFLASQWWLRDAALPYWLWFNLDPSYLYLIGGLDILQGAPPAQFQHPGAPVQLLVAAAAWLSGGDGISNAEAILTRASSLMFVLDAAALWLLGAAVRRSAGALVPAMLAQLAPFVTMLTLKHGLEVEPEPLLLFSALLLAASLVEDARAPRAATLVLAGFAVGFGAACKITFAPLGLAPLLALASWRRRLAYVALAAAWFALWMAVELPNLGPMADWFLGLAKGSGAYGQGAATVVDWAHYPHGFAKLFFARPLFLVAFALGLAALWSGRRARRADDAPMTPPERALLGLLAAQFVQIALAAKHPSGHYVLPALELAGPVLALSWLVLHRNRAPRPLLAGAFAGLLAIAVAGQSWAVTRLHAELARESKGALSLDLARDLPRCAHVYAFMASSPGAAWFYNDSYSGQRFAARLKAAMPPNDYYSVPWRRPLENWDGPVEPAAIAAQYPCIAVRASESGFAASAGALFGAAFSNPQKCRAGSETILVAGAECPKPSP